MRLEAEQVAALRQLRDLYPSSPLVLLGAAALGFHLEMSWRATKDLDVTLSIGLQDLSRIASLGGWRSIAEHRWGAPHGVIIDVVPAEPGALAGGKLRWPSGIVMSLLGFRAAFKNASETDVGGLVVGVPPVAVIVLLKMVAYQDRPAEREKDLEDIAHALDEHVAVADPRRFADEVYDLGFGYDESGAFLLGRDLAAVVDADERAAVLAFLDLVENDRDPFGAAIKIVRKAPSGWGAELSNKEESLKVRMRALRLGMGA